MNTFDITRFGAVAGGKVKCTEAFARAVEACAAAGGGRVVVPAGVFLTGPIRLRSYVNLHVERGATVLFSRDFDDYPLVVTDYEGEETVRCQSPLSGEELHDVSITGEGTFDGQGEAWRPVKKWKMTEQQWAELVASGGTVDEAHQIWWPTPQALTGRDIVEQLRKSGRPLRIEDYQPARDFLRPNMVKMTRCRNLRIEGSTFTNSGAWNVHLLLCENVVVRGVTILNPWYSSNGDALDIDACRNVTVADSTFDCGDDAICIKSGKDEAGRRRGRACENILVANCIVRHGHGGVTVGSEMSGGVRNLRVTNCIFTGTDIGLRFKSTRGRGGTVENVEISNVTMSDIRHEAISINLYYFVRKVTSEPVSERTPRFKDFRISNVVCRGAKRAIEIRGLPEMPVDRIHLQNIEVSAEQGALIADASNVTLQDVRLNVQSIPSLQTHNVRNLRLENFDGASPIDTPFGSGDL